MPDAKINGFKHHWEDMGSGDAFIMFHGAASAGSTLLKHAEALAPHFRVIVPDMRGLGMSEHVDSIEPSAWVDDLAALLDNLQIDSAHVYGTSLGSRVALKFAIVHPNRTKTLILENAIIAFESAGSNVMNQRLGNLEAMPPETMARYEALHGADWKSAVQAYYNWRNDPAVHAYYDMREGSKTLTVPTLLTRGDNREPVHPMPHTAELFENIKTSRLWIKPEGGLFATPEGYERVRGFIADPEKRPPPFQM